MRQQTGQATALIASNRSLFLAKLNFFAPPNGYETEESSIAWLNAYNCKKQTAKAHCALFITCKTPVWAMKPCRKNS